MTNETTAPSQPTQAVPDGWKLVPVTPTEEMIEASDFLMKKSAYDTWERMLSAAPPPPAGQREIPVAVQDGLRLVPDELLTRAVQLLEFHSGYSGDAEQYAANDMRALLAAPAAQTPPAQQSQSSTYPRRLTEKMKEAGQRAIERAHEDGCFGLHSLGYAYAEAALDAADDGDTAAPGAAKQQPDGWVVISPDGSMGDVYTDKQSALDIATDCDRELSTLHTGPAHRIAPVYIGDTAAPEQAEQPNTISVDRKDVELLAEFFEHENPHHLVVKALRVGKKFRALLGGEA